VVFKHAVVKLNTQQIVRSANCSVGRFMSADWFVKQITAKKEQKKSWSKSATRVGVGCHLQQNEVHQLIFLHKHNQLNPHVSAKLTMFSQ